MAMAGLERQPMRIFFFEISILPLGRGLTGFLLTKTTVRCMLAVSGLDHRPLGKP